MKNELIGRTLSRTVDETVEKVMSSVRTDRFLGIRVTVEESNINIETSRQSVEDILRQKQIVCENGPKIVGENQKLARNSIFFWNCGGN